MSQITGFGSYVPSAPPPINLPAFEAALLAAGISAAMVTQILNALTSAGLVTPDEDLGKYIFSLNPYNAVYPPPNTWATLLRTVVPFVPESDPHDYLFSLDPAGIEHHEQPGDWKFKEADHYVQRAIRIPYKYYKRSGLHPSTEGVIVKDYFLIGFEGGHGY